jgi:phosphoenolpyruvate synthase/pyruvate phosphate dikinase
LQGRVFSQTQTLFSFAAAVTGTNTTANATLPAPVNTTAAATALNSTSNTTAIQAAVVARTLGLATAVITLNTTSLPTYITNDFSVFAANTSGPLT